MRRKAVFADRLCALCGVAFSPNGSVQRFCPSCKILKTKETKLRYYHKHFPDAKPKVKSTEVCCACGGKFSCHFDGKPYCNKHYLRMKIHGTIDLVGRKTRNSFDVNGSTATIVTTRGEEILIDSSDLEIALRYTWCISKTGYVVANVENKVTKLHRYLLRVPQDKVVDHINGNPLDNRRENLRVCDQAENSRNAKRKPNCLTGTTGIQQKSNGRFRARIMVNRKEIALGTFDSYEEAVAARLNAEKDFFGEFALSASRGIKE